jgi:hypothetical protein
MTRLFVAITVCAAVMTIAKPTTQVPVTPSARHTLIADGPLPPPDDPDNPPNRSVEV